MKIKKYILILYTFIIATSSLAQQDILDGWTYIQIDSTKQMWGDWNEPNWLRYFGLDAGDVNNDGNLDIVSGRYIYHNPGKGMEGHWKRTVLDDNVDVILYVDVDGDPYGDIIAMALPNLYWYEALNTEGTRYKRRLIGQVPATSHVNSQGFEKANLVTTGRSEFVIAGNGNIYAISIPEANADAIDWKVNMICENTSDEGIGIGDIDGDGDLDIAAGRRPDGEDEPKILVWYENPGNIETLWKETIVGRSEYPIDRVEIADLNGDGKTDIVVTEERYPGLEPDANFWWFAQQDSMNWERNRIVTQYSINNLDITDLDQDGDIDLLTAEHKGENLELQLWKNDGKGNFSKTVIDTGKENHLGTKFVDLDNDGDLDIIGAGWDQHRYMHVWRNDAVKSSKSGMLPKKYQRVPDSLGDYGKLQHVDGKLDYASNENSFQKDGYKDNYNLLNQAKNNVGISQSMYESRPHFIVHTKGATYYFDRAGGGFSRILDAYGNDWVSYRREPWDQYPASAASAFRGLPNLVFKSEKDKGAGHPGHDKCISEVVSENKIRTRTKSGLWEWEWTFFENYAVLEVLKTDNTPYWFLYEGTPGGSFIPEISIYGTDVSGPNSEIPDFYKGDINFNNFRWAYFNKEGLDTAFFVAQIDEDEHMDMMSYLGNTAEGAKSKDGMTVFGFGRGENTTPLLEGKNSFIIGMQDFAAADKGSHQKISEYINELIKEHNR